MKANEFKAARKKLDLTQEQIGAKLGDDDGGYSLRAVASWESGKRGIPPAVAKLVKLMLRAKEASEEQVNG